VAAAPGGGAMTVLDRFLLRTYLRSLGGTYAVFLVAGTVLEFLEKARVLLSERGTAGQVLLFLVCRSSELAVLLLPLALVVGIGLAHAYLSRGLEMRALAAAGIGTLRILPVLLFCGLLTMVASAVLSEWVVPAALRTQLQLERKLGWTNRAWRFFKNRQWFLGQRGRIYRVSGRSRDGQSLRRAELFVLDEHFQLAERVLAERVHYQQGHWRARRVRRWRFAAAAVKELPAARDVILDWPEGPERFRPLRGRPRQKGLAELAETSRLLERRGARATSYRLEMHLRFAFPLLGLLLVLVAFPFQTLPYRRRSVSGALFEAVLLVMGAWLVVAVCTTAVGGGLLEPWLGGWLPVMVVAVALLVSWVLVYRAPAGGTSA